jgi:DNA-binding GntR family transcriptional regulator
MVKKSKSKSAAAATVPAPASARSGRRLAEVKRETLKDRIYLEVRHALQAGTFEPGEAITVKLLEEELGAGAMPIRQSLQRLVAEGALLNLPSGRVRVPLVTAEEFDEIKEIRLRLEGLAAQRAALQMDDAALARIREQYDRLTGLLSTKFNPAEVVACNYQFHFAIYQAAQARQLLSIIDSLWLRVSPLLVIPFKQTGRPRAEYAAIHEQTHARLLEALAERDGRGAEATLREIILASAAWYHRHHEFAEPDGGSGRGRASAGARAQRRGRTAAS